MTIPAALCKSECHTDISRQRKTCGEQLDAIANAVVRFHYQHHGRGPSSIQVRWDGNHITIRSQGIFTPAETHLLTTRNGRQLVERMRQELHRIVCAEVESTIASIIGAGISGRTLVLDMAAAEQIEVYELNY